MGKLTWSGLDETYREMARAEEQCGEIAQEMLRVGGEKCVEAWRIAIGAYGHSPPGESERATGEMGKSVGVKFKKKDGKRVAEIYPLGKDSHGVRNAEKAFVLHYGRSNMKGDHFVDEADRISEENAVPAMIEVWENSK